MTRVAVIGNAGGGKSTLARKLAAAHGLPLHEVDLLQWRPDWTPAPPDEVAAAYDQILADDAWIIDGWGTWDAVEKRFDLADTVILVDLPLWVHYWWSAQRLIAAATGEQPESPPGCPWLPVGERLFKLIWDIHQEMRPRLLAMVEMQRQAGKTVFHIQSREDLEAFASIYCVGHVDSCD
ncbi:MAG TPA: hypothetical protein VF120_05380 [Ktedonobacterales bacterium]